VTLRMFGADQRGNFTLLFALAFVVAIGAAAVGVDSASLYYERRQVQASVDLAAMTAAGNPAEAQRLAQLVMVDAGLLPPDSTTGLTVVTGRYFADVHRPIEQRFTPGATPVNAVQVSFEKPGTLYFGRSFTSSPQIGATALAAFTPEVSFGLGTRLASLNQGVANRLLTALLGTNVSLSVMDYNALASARVDALSFLGALGQQLDIETGSYVDILNMRARSGQIAAALADVTTGPVHQVLNVLSNGGRGTQVLVGKLVNLGVLGSRELGSGSSAGVSLSALEVIMAAARLSDGQKQVTLDLVPNVPNLTALQVALAIGEAPQGSGWTRIGERGATVRSSQLRLRILAQLLGGDVLLRAGVRVPILLDVAHAEAQVSSITCPTAENRNGSAVIAVRPGVLKLSLGEASDEQLRNFGQPLYPGRVKLIDVLLLKVSGAAQVEIAQNDSVMLSFSSQEIGAGATKTARTRTMVTSLMTSLFNSLDIRVDVGPLLVPLTLLEGTVRALITPLGPTLDLTLAGVFSALGLGLGEADVKVFGVRCTAPALVR